MITRIRKQLFSLRHTYTNPLDKQRAQILLVVNVAVIVLSVVTTILLILPGLISTGSVDWAGTFTSVIVIAAALVSYQMIQNGRLNLAIWIILVAITLGTLSGILFGNNGLPSISTSVIVFLTVPIVAAGVLLNRRGLLLITAMTLIGVTAVALVQRNNLTPVTYVPAESAIIDYTQIATGIIAVAAVLLTFLGSLQRIANESFQLITQRNWLSNFSLKLNAIDNEVELLTTALNLTRQSFGQRFIEIYLINEDGNLTLATGVSSRRSIIRSSDPNILAEATRTRTLLTTSLEDDPARHSHLAASTSYAAAVPLLVNDTLMGVLDFQDVNPFFPNDFNTLQEIANQIALHLQRVRVQTELKNRVDDHEKTISRLQVQLQDFNRRQQQNISEVWGNYIQGRGKQAFGYNLEGDLATPVLATDLPAGLANTLQHGQLEVSTQGTEQVINVPIKFRDTNLGAMSFAVPSNQPLSSRQIEIATIVSERLALALENTRLFEQSQSQALRERKASEVATALIGATDVRVVLNMAAEQFKDALGAVNTRIFIQPETLMEPLAQSQEEK